MNMGKGMGMNLNIGQGYSNMSNSSLLLPITGLTIGTNMYVEPDQISTSMSSSGEEDFEEDSYQYSYMPSYSSDVSDINNINPINHINNSNINNNKNGNGNGNGNGNKEDEDNDNDDIRYDIRDDDSYGITIFPDEHYIANFSANGILPEIPSFEREYDDEDNNGKIKRARAKSDSKFIMNDDKNRNMNIIEEEGNDGYLHPSGGVSNSHKRLNSTGNFDTFDKPPNFDCYDEDLEMPNLLSQDLYSKVLRKKFRRAVQIIQIVRRLSSRSSMSSSSFSNNQDISDTSSYYSNVNNINKMDSKKMVNGLTLGNHSRTSSMTSNLSNIMTTPTMVSDILPMSSTKSLDNNTPISPTLSERQFEKGNEKGKKQKKK
jgi:hypothetical protein